MAVSSTYAEAREQFLRAAEAAGATIFSDVHPDRGLDGEELAIDVAEMGPPDADTALLVVSGTHGVEGYLGSALQSEHLTALAADPVAAPSDHRLIFVHALNPVGFSWVRRVNEDNVDLNRNFVDWSYSPPRNVDYASIAADLVPDIWTAEEQERSLAALLTQAEAVGFDRFQEIVTGGQYDHPKGLFYGGVGPTWSHRWFVAYCDSRLASLRRLAVIDLHTGLGPWGHGELISSEAPSTATYERQTRWYETVSSLKDGSSVSAELIGEWLGALDRLLPGVETTGVAIEYGTVDTISVLQALRADAVLHGHGDPSGPDAAAVRAQVRAAFCDDDPSWFATCHERYEFVAGAALAGLSDHSAS